jgi:hypothetical protein
MRDADQHHRDWAGRSAFVLAVGVAIGWSVAVLFVVSPWRTTPVGDAAANFLATLGGAMVGAVATYLGSTGRRPWAQPKPEEPKPDA